MRSTTVGTSGRGRACVLWDRRTRPTSPSAVSARSADNRQPLRGGMLPGEGASMARLLSLLLGLLVVAGVAYYVLEGTTRAVSAGPSAPKQQLDSVRDRAKEIERDAQKRADELLK